jgi:hypothetical protein
VDFDRHAIIVREAKGSKDRVVMLPHALEQKYPQVGNALGWFWMFPSPTLSIDPRTCCNPGPTASPTTTANTQLAETKYSRLMWAPRSFTRSRNWVR